MIHDSRNSHTRRRGVVIVLALVMLVVLIGFASLTLDVGALYNARADLQNAADAAALAGASVLSEDAMAQVRIGKKTSAPEVTQAMYERAAAVAFRVTSFGGKNVILGSADMTAGWTDLASANSDVDDSTPASQFNSIHVVAHRSGASANGPVVFFFASIFGTSTADVSASATAAFDDRVSGYDPGAGGADLWPTTIGVDVYDSELAKNSDSYSFDGENVTSDDDGVPEINLYPLSTSPGNFGLLNIGNSNQSVNNSSDQIENGVPPEKLESEIGEPILDFYDDQGQLVAHTIRGTPGLKASLHGVIKGRVGDIVAVPVHDGYSGSGANTKYNIVGVRFVRIMAASLQSGTKYLYVQPVTYSGPGVVIDPNAPSSGGAGGRIVLVR